MEWFQYVLSERSKQPDPILPFGEIRDSREILDILEKYNRRYDS